MRLLTSCAAITANAHERRGRTEREDAEMHSTNYPDSMSAERAQGLLRAAITGKLRSTGEKVSYFLSLATCLIAIPLIFRIGEVGIAVHIVAMAGGLVVLLLCWGAWFCYGRPRVAQRKTAQR